MKQQTHSEIAEQKFRPLKKSLRTHYKKIQADLGQERLPDAALLSDFIALTKIMISYPGFGDEYYEDFSKACLSFKEACKQNNLSLARKSFELIMRIKHECHHRQS